MERGLVEKKEDANELVDTFNGVCYFMCSVHRHCCDNQPENPLAVVHDLPPAIGQRAQELGLIKENQRSGSRVVLVKKIAAALIIALLFAITVYCFNDARSFADGF